MTMKGIGPKGRDTAEVVDVSYNGRSSPFGIKNSRKILLLQIHFINIKTVKSLTNRQQ